MSRYDGLIIPRSYSENINKTDAATLLQALQLSGVMDAAPTTGSNHPVKSGGVFGALGVWETLWSEGSSSIKGIETINGKYLAINFQGVFGGNHNAGDVLFTITNNKYKPTITMRFIVLVLKSDSTRTYCDIDYGTDGTATFYPPSNEIEINGMYGNFFIKIE